MRAAAAVGIGLIGIMSLSAEAGGFREQRGWQFRSPAETQTLLNLEVRRLRLRGFENGNGTAVALGASHLAGGGPGGGAASGASELNTTEGSTVYNVTVEGDGNRVEVDGYLNLTTTQTAERVRSRVRNR